ncbi:MAG: hypothetical protein PVG32_09605 [Anaerolineales bacterium]
MKNKARITIVVLAVLVLVVTSVAYAKGNSPAQLTRAGWFCEDVSPLGVHCFSPGAFKSSPSIQVKFFNTTDPTSTDAEFLGTELLLRADLYRGQPCPQEGESEWHLLPADETPFPVDYRACHHH